MTIILKASPFCREDGAGVRGGGGGGWGGGMVGDIFDKVFHLQTLGQI